VIAHIGVQGDFEITMGYEILKEPAASARQTRLTLGIPSGEGENFASISRSLWPGSGDRWFTYLRVGKAKPRGDTYPTAAAKGRLRLVRAGSYLLYYAAEGDGEFTLLQIHSFGTEDVSDVHITGSTGGPEATLDARVSDLHIRAQGLTNVPVAAEIAAQTPEPPRRLWWLLAVLAAVVVLAGGGVLLRRRFQRRSDIPEASSGPRARAVVKVACPGCQKRLSLPTHMAGKKIKCSACATTFVAPG
jgi:LSD1 subclass zinc finger protein